MQKHYRTKCKAGILEYLEKNKEHGVSASDIYSYMQEHAIQVNLATIYRNLEKLTENGLLMKYKTAGEESCLYQYVEPYGHCQEHLHMQCRECGRIFHLECKFMSDISRHLMEDHGFFLECQGSVLTGLCEECRVEK